ncbi:Noc2p family protein (macronuclear) [Tetrahymena thermophila SB210]|uniref:Noc2p family protein n=1 Tax=Tetrahymena thermophila (strain SB210) TaxID=312017 RepID=Q24CL6_TETTS|nr:Noc2p family protein [Tetrahymena thermophila SB210]EAS05513.2 Noc2p family protein [Tetrahymena thermophila SB210]|eukprot:XP_001025758.2 Noc2p family protein [Tetrahymena thermophila SB210]
MVASKVISLKRVEDIIQKVEKEPTQKSIAHFIKIFRICVSQNEDENVDELEENKNEQDFIIEDGAVYDKVVTFALQRFPYLLKKLLKLEDGQILESVSSRKLDIVLKVYLLNIVKMAENVHDEDMLIYMLTFYPIITDFMFPLKKLFMRFLKYMVELWATNNNLKLKLKAFIVIRRICKNTKSEEVDKIFRRVYAAYFENVRHVSWRTYESVIFMINCYTELMMEHKDAAYYIGFSYLRQIAVLLKDNMAKKGDEMKVFNWQVINSLKLWSQTISRQPADEDLGQLLYPLVELIIGVNQFSNSQEYVPLKFHLIQCLNSIAQKTDTFIPTLKLIKDVLNSGEFRKKKTQSTKKPFDFSISLKIDNKYKNTNVLWNEIFKFGLDLSAEYLAIYSRDIGFPEMCYNYIKYLKKLSDSVQFVVYKMQIKELMKTIRASVDLVLSKRKGVNFAPKNIEQDAKFSEDNFKDVKETPLEQLRNKIVSERETRIKQRILAEKDQNYDEGDDGEDEAAGDEEDEDMSGDESGDDGTDKKKKKIKKDLDIADESDSDAFDPENYKDSDEEDNKEDDEEEYDFENMDYEGDPDDLPDFDLIDEVDDNNDDNQLSEDDFDNEDEENEEGEGEEEQEEEVEEKQDNFKKSKKGDQKSQQFQHGNKKKQITKNRNKNNKFSRGGKNQKNFRNNKKQNFGKRRK